MNATHAPPPGSGQGPPPQASPAPPQAGPVSSPRGSEPARENGGAPARVLGIDLGGETIKIVELARVDGQWRWTRRVHFEHAKQPGPRLVAALADFDWPTLSGAASSGRLARLVRLPRVPTKQAQARAYRFLFGNDPATVISIGSHGFSVLELRGRDIEIFRENSRCSQGTGNFLRQLTERFGLDVGAASALCADVSDPAPLSGRCPVILKTDMTHLANKGESRDRILAGLFDAVGANVLTLLKPRLSPSPVALIGGVSRSLRVQRTVARFLSENGFESRTVSAEDALFFEALGSALVAAERQAPLPTLSEVLAGETRARLERLPPLAQSLALVRRMVSPAAPPTDGLERRLVLGLDIGSTGSKLVALDTLAGEALWDCYRRTGGDPVGAAQALIRAFVDGPAGRFPVLGLGVTGSGREMVGSLCRTCYGSDAVLIINEIVAHAEGALHYDSRVDTIFEIGGQDAKYIRLDEGRVIDCAMNEACSAGTGSFIEEQGRKFAGLDDVSQLGREALAASHGVSLGQHCSVFMAEVIDEAVAGGVEQSAILAGLYDSIIQNYLNRVKGSRSVGRVIFCQGMPFAADALAAAVARQTGGEVIIPPNPGTVGALGIALLARGAISLDRADGLDLGRFLSARVERKDTFVCQATAGCGGSGNHCRIDSLTTVVRGERRVFRWGGACALYDKGTRRIKLPDRSPDPFREREALVADLMRRLDASPPGNGTRRRIALTDEFALKGLLPFFAVFLRTLDFDLRFHTGAGRVALKRGIQEANVPFCAPMQLYCGLANQLADEPADYLFLPMIRHLPRVDSEPLAKTCPILQASPDMIRWGLDGGDRSRLLSPVIDVGLASLDSPEFAESCRRLAASLGIGGGRWRGAWEAACEAQLDFDRRCLEIGGRALEFCAGRDVLPIVVLGRPYTIYNTVLNSNVPALLREQGALAVPLDCYPVDRAVPVFSEMYWAYGQRVLRAAHQIRRTPGVYGLYASNYSCGPDSFNLHFCAHVMEGKPFAVIETDGHSGDAGTKTRIEAFLHCVREDRRQPRAESAPSDFGGLARAQAGWRGIRDRGEVLLIPRMGGVAETVAACFRGLGVRAECLPEPDAEALRLGRRQTSGKECLPMCITLGSLLQRAAGPREPGERLALLMPCAAGPCRFGVYSLLHQIVVDRLGLGDRVRLWSPKEADYFAGLPPGFSLLLFSGVMAFDVLHEALLETRPLECRPGAAAAIHSAAQARLERLLEEHARADLSARAALHAVASGQLFGLRDLVARTAADLAAVRVDRPMPTVLVVGEIYVRLDPFANSGLIRELEARGLRVRLAAVNEWLEYVEHFHQKNASALDLSPRLKVFLQNRIQNILHRAAGRAFDWPERISARDCLDAALPYLRPTLEGEAVLTLGGPIRAWRLGQIDAVVSAGPLECMPNKIAEAQFFHVAEQEGLLSLTLALNGEPVAPDVLDNFAFEVHERFARRASERTPSMRPRSASAV
ncbi:MAG TPA: acyl-CoA dehydratase activase-related protein [Verrucomicrobiota bacterium]|nr:acyl-CoA dehydratase activase-related protein [Verrucomicrobiota bacterium]